MIINNQLVEILQLLEKNGSTCVKDICEKLHNNCQPVISQRLRVLKDMGLVKSSQRMHKARVFYEINPNMREAVHHLVQAYEYLQNK